MTVSLGRLADINPSVPEFDELDPDAEVTFMPLETVWADGRADTSRRAAAGSVGSGYTRFVDGDILLPKITPTFEAGRVFAVEIETSVGAGTTELHVLRPLGDVDGRYIAYVCRSQPFLQEGHASIQGVGNLRRIPLEWLAKYPIPVTDPVEQRAVADYLDRETAQIDTLIAKQRVLRHRLAERRESLVEQAVTRGLDAQAEVHATPLGWANRMPAHWQRARLRHVAILTAGGTPDTDELSYWAESTDADSMPWIAIADMSRRVDVSESKKHVTQAGLSAKKLHVGRPGTLLFAMYASVGEVATLRVPATWNQAILGIEVAALDRLSPDYLTHVLRAMRPYLLADVRSNTQANLNATQVGDIWIPIPPLAEQEAIVSHLKGRLAEIDALVARADRFVELAAERRTALITAAVTGTLDIGAAA